MARAPQPPAKNKATHRHREQPVVVMESLTKDEATWRAMADQAAEFGWRLLDLSFSSGWIPTEPPPIGAIIRHPAPSPLVDRLSGLGCSIVRYGYGACACDDVIPAVISDTAAAGAMGADHFHERGFRTVGYVANSPFRDGKPIYDGFAARAAELGMACSLLGVTNVEWDLSQKFVERADQIRDWLENLPKPIGVMTYSDTMAARVCYVCHANGFAVPEEVAILGIGNSPFTCESAPISLSAIDSNEPARVQAVLRLLHDHMNGNALKAAVAIPPKGVVVRRSTDVFAVQDPVVAKALRFLWDYLDVDLSVDDIAEEAGVSRRSLERGFRRQLNRGVNEELRRKRLERCCEILLDTDLPLNEIVPMVGLRSKAYLHRAFLKAYGVTPGEYRNTHGRG